MPKTLNFVTYEQMTIDARTKLVPMIAAHEPEAIFGVPRAGLMVASIVAAQLHLPLYSIDPSDGKIIHLAGSRRLGEPSKPHSVAVVDDSSYQGSSVGKAVKACRKAGYKICADTGFVLYNHPKQQETNPNYTPEYVRMIGGDRLFAWNWASHSLMQEAMLDIDGLVCVDPEHRDDDSDGYCQCIATAAPLSLPRSHKVLAFCTHRLERWRSVTELWLKHHGVRWEFLLMPEFETAQERRDKIGPYGAWKGFQYKNSAATLFVESCPKQAKRIFETSKKRVLCPITGEVWQ